MTISIEDDAVEVTSELEAAFAERYVDSLTAFYLARGTAVAPGDIQVTVSPAAPRGARRALLQDAAPGASLEAGVSLLFPFSEIDFDVIRDTGVEEATALLRESAAAGAADAPAPPEPFASGEEILPAVLLVAADVRERFDAARLAASSRFSVGADPAALGGRCAGGLFSVRVPCEEPVRLSDLGFASAGEGGALGAVLAAVSASAQGCPGDTSLPSVRASDTDVLVCSARGGAGAQLLVQAARSPSVVDAIVAGSMRLSSAAPAAAAPAGAGASSAADAASLLNIKRSLGSPALFSWSPETVAQMCGGWLGVECDAIGRVRRLRLTDGELAGDVRELKWLGYLSDLAAVDLASDALVGEAAELAGVLRGVALLAELRLAAPGIRGDITGVSQLPLLRRLELSLPNCRGDLRMVEPLAGLERLTVMSNAVTGNVTRSVGGLPKLQRLSLVGPMVGSGAELPMGGGMEDVLTLGRGFELLGEEELLSTFERVFPEAPGGASAEEDACVDVGGSFCDAFLKAPECQQDSELGRRLREQCEKSCAVCGGCADALDICPTVATEALCATERIRSQCPLSCGACGLGPGR
ncbi:MAG: hypothetical protein VX460_05495 [Planctomycetota bacterium]|nr:hypothetical protein [Planctomycetota bacterium]